MLFIRLLSVVYGDIEKAKYEYEGKYNMYIYLGLLLVSGISLIIYNNTKKRLFAIIPYYSMAFVGGFRDGVGTDFFSYKQQFYEIIERRGWYINFEPGFRLMINIIDKVSGSYQVMFLIMSCLTCFFYYKFIEEYSKNFSVSTLLFLCLGPFYLSTFNGIRQALAVSMFLYSLKYLNKETWKYILIILIASTFHFTAAILLLMPLCKKFNKNYVIYYLAGVFLIYLAVESRLIDWLTQRFISSRVRLIGNIVNMDISYIIYFIICLLVIVGSKKLHLNVDKNVMYMVVVTEILVTLAILFPSYSMIFTRLTSYGSPMMLILVPLLSSSFKQKKIYNFSVCSFGIIYYIRIINSGVASLLPYAFNFNLYQ